MKTSRTAPQGIIPGARKRPLEKTDAGALERARRGQETKAGEAGPSRAAGGGAAVDEVMRTQGPATELSGLTTRAVEDRDPVKAEAKYDYVVVGAGAGGAPLAARLAEEGYKVLVLEAGEDKAVKESEVPAFHGAASDHPELLVDGEGYFVQHFSDEEMNKRDSKYVDDKGGIFYPRGEGFGGSTRMNAQIFVRVDDKDWDDIAEATGDPSFRSGEMKQWIQKLEKQEYRPVLRFLHEVGDKIGWDALKNLSGHGHDGWLETTRADPRLLLRDKQLLRIAWETIKFSATDLGPLSDKLKRLITFFDSNDDLAQGTEGLTLTPQSVTGMGRRNGPRDRLLDVAERHPENLTLMSGVKVKDVVLNDENEVTAVRYRDRDGQLHTEPVGKEAIISCGAFETPALLMRSGIGPKDQLDKLKDHGVTPRVELPGVGKSLSDRYEVGIVTKMKRPFTVTDQATFKPDPNDPHFKEWEEGKGIYANNGVTIAFQAKSDPSLPDPDLYIFGVPGTFKGYYPGYSQDAVKEDDHFTWLVLHENKTDKEGHVQIDPETPEGQPDINFMYHHEETATPNDSAPVVEGVKMVRKLIAQYSDLVEEEIWPGPGAKTDADIKQFVEAESWGHHANGTTKMGHPSDPEAVVDADFKVLGTKGLRVVDASTFPDSPGSFIVSAVMQQAEKAAMDIIADDQQGNAGAATYNPLSIRMVPKPKTRAEAAKLTKDTAQDAAKAQLISPAQLNAIADGTVSNTDKELAWRAIEEVLDGGGHLSDDRHTLAHNLLLAVSRQLERQGGFETRRETFKDALAERVGLR